MNLPVLPLQLLMRQHPEWRDEPVAVVDQDKPQGRVLWANGKARKLGVLPGMRYAAALGLARSLRAGTVSEASIDQHLEGLIRHLQRFSPRVEASREEPGVFWLDVQGLSGLFGSLADWADLLRGDLMATGFEAVVVVGFSRFGTYAVAKTLRKRRVWVFVSCAGETAAIQRVPLAALGLPPAARDGLGQLGIRWVGELVKLPASGVLRRFGPEVHRVRQWAAGVDPVPLQPLPLGTPLVRQHVFDYLETDWTRLLFMLKPLLESLLADLARQGEALSELTLTLCLDGGQTASQVLQTAEPTLESGVVMELLRLRLEATSLQAAVVEAALQVRGSRATQEQLTLFAQTPRRDLAAAGRALARIRAAFGDQSVVRTVIRDKHAPEARFGFEPCRHLAWPQPGASESASLVRWLWDKPQPLADAPRRGWETWRPLGPQAGRITRLDGPYVLSGGWWKQEVRRDYYFAELESGRLIWIYYDRRRQVWFWQGEVS